MSRKSEKVIMKETENHEGLMLSSSQEFNMLVKNKAAMAFAKAEERARKPVKLDLLLTKLYLAL